MFFVVGVSMRSVTRRVLQHSPELYTLVDGTMFQCAP